MKFLGEAGAIPVGGGGHPACRPSHKTEREMTLRSHQPPGWKPGNTTGKDARHYGITASILACGMLPLKNMMTKPNPVWSGTNGLNCYYDNSSFFGRRVPHRRRQFASGVDSFRFQCWSSPDLFWRAFPGSSGFFWLGDSFSPAAQPATHTSCCEAGSKKQSAIGRPPAQPDIGGSRRPAAGSHQKVRSLVSPRWIRKKSRSPCGEMAKPFGCPWKPPPPCVKRRPPAAPGNTKTEVFLATDF